MRTAHWFLLIGLAACGGEAEVPTPEPTLQALPAVVTKALDLQHAIAASGGSAEAVLTAKGITRDELDAMMAEIAADPALTAAFEQGRK